MTMNWKTKTYFVGWLAGTALGLLSAYLFIRSAEDDGEIDSGEVRMNTGTILSLALAILGLVRQIAEAGKPKKK